MSMDTDKLEITIYDHLTGITVVREMTAEEIASLPTEPTALPEAPDDDN